VTVARSSAFRAVACAFIWAALAAGARAEYGRTPESYMDVSALAIDEAKFLGAPLDGDVMLLGEDGQRFRLAELFGKPVLLLFSYYNCDGVCPAVNRSLARVIDRVQRVRPAEDFRVLTLSFDRKDRLEDLRHFVEMLGLAPEARAGWRFAVFAQGGDIERIAERVGYRWFWSVRDRVFVHPNVLIVLSPEGRVARYLPSTGIGPRDIELALIESDWNRVLESGRLRDLVAGVCFSYSFRDGRYVLNAPLFIAAGSLTLGCAAAIASFAVFRRSRRREALSA
jgi:protein SCO1/2